jgi:hypothetical protein
MDFLIARLREPSTYAGVAAFVGALAFLPHAADISQSVGIVGTAVAGLLAIWLPETKK